MEQLVVDVAAAVLVQVCQCYMKVGVYKLLQSKVMTRREG